MALVPPRDEYPAGRITGIAPETPDARGLHEELKSRGVDAGAALMGGDGTVPGLLRPRDRDANSLMVVQPS